ncbi:thioredoxin family protein [Microbacterium sp. SS28]|uniref:thioredoxin family protein n=1 Tax=Microbacterium sp. SS28 TaxID=2919948 RepID=UPI001FAAF85F|nr:thioredoxin family protein [Microbacterium sp. SS28]
MKVEVLHIGDCPNWVEAGNRIREALDATGLDDVEVTFRLLTAVEDAARVPFAGSPTILLDGKDLFPSGDQSSALACRVYPTPVGLAGLPTTSQIIEALAPHVP